MVCEIKPLTLFEPPYVMFRGAPEKTLTMPEICQPPAIVFRGMIGGGPQERDVIHEVDERNVGAIKERWAHIVSPANVGVRDITEIT